MGEENNNNKNILAQIESEHKKSELDGHKSKLKDMLKRKNEAAKVVQGIDREIEKYLEENGLS
jgi:DNA repair ATPase RecN